MSKPSDLVQGTLDLLLLKIIALEPQHGWAISQRLRQVSNDELQASDGSVYPALQKLELAGWIRSEWKTSDMGRRAKFYTLTPAGDTYQVEPPPGRTAMVCSACEVDKSIKTRGRTTLRFSYAGATEDIAEGLERLADFTRRL